jgi:hypothetical protein
MIVATKELKGTARGEGIPARVLNIFIAPRVPKYAPVVDILVPKLSLGLRCTMAEWPLRGIVLLCIPRGKGRNVVVTGAAS